MGARLLVAVPVDKALLEQALEQFRPRSNADEKLIMMQMEFGECPPHHVLVEIKSTLEAIVMDHPDMKENVATLATNWGILGF